MARKRATQLKGGDSGPVVPDAHLESGARHEWEIDFLKSGCPLRFWDAPFRIVIDTREQIPYEFHGIPANVEDGGGFVRVETIRFSLPEGDYGLELDRRIRIERKSKADLWSTVAQGRDRFEAELARLQERCEWAAVVVEAEWQDAMTQPGFSCLNPKSLNRSILAWMQRYKTVHWVWRPDRATAEVATFWLLHRWWRDHNP